VKPGQNKRKSEPNFGGSREKRMIKTQGRPKLPGPERICSSPGHGNPSEKGRSNRVALGS